jgi:hypothetical protein
MNIQMMRHLFCTALSVLSLLGCIPVSAYEVDAEDPTAGSGTEAPWRDAARWDRIDEAATTEIHRHTTDPSFLTPLVSYIPESDSVPSPRDFLGYIAGTEGKLTRPEDTARYFQALAKSSPRVRLLEMGQTDEGRTMLLVVISDETNLARLDHLKASTARLADPRVTDPGEAQTIILDAKPIVHLTAGLHSPETGPPEMVMELAYRLAVSAHPEIKRIRDDVITLITPILEVDGRARQVDWYYRHLTEYENRLYMPSVSPPYWGKYTFHDNNRDGLQVSQKLTENYLRTFFEWHPTYSLDLHESVPLLYVSTGTGPYNRFLDPIVISEWQWLANWEVAELTRQGLPGVWTWGFYTGWNPSYLLWITNNHNALGRFYETFGNHTARTQQRDISESTFSGKKVTSRQWYRSRPPSTTFNWSLRNNTNYMQSGVIATLGLVARHGDRLLDNFYRKGVNSLERGRSAPPYGWVIPGDQSDSGRLAGLLNLLQRQGIEIHRSTADFEIGDQHYASGDFVVQLDQPYADLAKNLLSVQLFPEDADSKPYDDVSWPLGLHYRIETIEIDDPAVLELTELELIEIDVHFEGTLKGKGSAAYAVRQTGQNALITARHRLADIEVLAAEESFEAGGTQFPAGSWIIPAQDGLDDLIPGLARELGLDFQRLKQQPDVATHPLNLPRLALYHNWTSTQDDGWVRYTLEAAGVRFDYINDDVIRAGGLRNTYDLIMMANQGGGAKRMVHGRDPKFGPMAFTPTDDFPSHGVIDASADITGGIGFKGLANLEQFLDDGGTLLLLGASGRLATDFGLLRNVSSTSGVNTPGSSLTVRVQRPDHPISHGFTATHPIYRVNGPLYDVPKQYEHWIVVQYGTEDADPASAEADLAEPEGDDGTDEPLLISGYLDGQKELTRKGVVLDVPRSNGGRVILYSFNPMHRYLNHGDHNYVFNAILNWDDFPAPIPEDHPGLERD